MDWSLNLQMRKAAESLVPVWARDGSIVWVASLPRNVSLSYIEVPDTFYGVAATQPQLLPALRASIFGSRSNLVSPPLDYAARVPPCPGGLAQILATETETAKIALDKQMGDLHLVMDYTGYRRPTVYALPNKNSVAAIVKYVGRAVKDDDFDEPSTRLFCSMLRRHDRYLSVFGDIPPELLELGYGPSQKHPESECLYAIYYPDNPGLGPWLRLDIGADVTFSNSLHEPHPTRYS
jgi:hypothetical protein